MEKSSLSFHSIIACHKKGVCVATTTFDNKTKFLADINVIWFPELGHPMTDFPFSLDFSFDITNRISFPRIKKKFANKLFPKPPAIFRNTAVQRSGMLYIYCEIRPKQDKLKNVRKTVKYLQINEWVGVVHPHKELTIYLIPTSTVSHDLGLTVDLYPPLLHALFVYQSTEYDCHFVNNDSLKIDKQEIVQISEHTNHYDLDTCNNYNQQDGCHGYIDNVIENEFQPIEVMFSANCDPVPVTDIDDNSDPRVGRIYYVYQSDTNKQLVDDKHSKKVSLEEYKQRRKRVAVDYNDGEEIVPLSPGRLVIDEEVSPIGSRKREQPEEIEPANNDGGVGRVSSLPGVDTTRENKSILVAEDIVSRCSPVPPLKILAYRSFKKRPLMADNTDINVVEKKPRLDSQPTVKDECHGSSPIIDSHGNSPGIDNYGSNSQEKHGIHIEDKTNVTISEPTSQTTTATTTSVNMQQQQQHQQQHQQQQQHAQYTIHPPPVTIHAHHPLTSTQLTSPSLPPVLHAPIHPLPPTQFTNSSLPPVPMHAPIHPLPPIQPSLPPVPMHAPIHPLPPTQPSLPPVPMHAPIHPLPLTQPSLPPVPIHGPMTPIHSLPPTQPSLPPVLHGPTHNIGNHPHHAVYHPNNHYPFQSDVVPHAPPTYPIYYGAPTIQGPRPWGQPVSSHPLNPAEFREIATILQQGRALQRSLGLINRPISLSRSRSCSRSRSRSRSRSCPSLRSRSYSKSCSRSRSRSRSPQSNKHHSPVRVSRSGGSSRYTRSPSRIGGVSIGTQVGVAMYNSSTQCKPKVNSVLTQTTFRSRNVYSQTSLSLRSRGVQTDSQRPRSRTTSTQTDIVDYSDISTQTTTYTHPAINNLIDQTGKQLLGDDVHNEKTTVFDWLVKKINLAENFAEDIESAKLSPLSGCSNISEGNWSDDTPLVTSPNNNNKTNDNCHQKKSPPNNSKNETTEYQATILVPEESIILQGHVVEGDPLVCVPNATVVPMESLVMNSDNDAVVAHSDNNGDKDDNKIDPVMTDLFDSDMEISSIISSDDQFCSNIIVLDDIETVTDNKTDSITELHVDISETVNDNNPDSITELHVSETVDDNNTDPITELDVSETVNDNNTDPITELDVSETVNDNNTDPITELDVSETVNDNNTDPITELDVSETVNDNNTDSITELHVCETTVNQKEENNTDSISDSDMEISSIISSNFIDSDTCVDKEMNKTDLVSDDGFMSIDLSINDGDSDIEEGELPPSPIPTEGELSPVMESPLSHSESSDIAQTRYRKRYEEVIEERSRSLPPVYRATPIPYRKSHSSSPPLCKQRLLQSNVEPINRFNNRSSKSRKVSSVLNSNTNNNNNNNNVHFCNLMARAKEHISNNKQLGVIPLTPSPLLQVVINHPPLLSEPLPPLPSEPLPSPPLSPPPPSEPLPQLPPATENNVNDTIDNEIIKQDPTNDNSSNTSPTSNTPIAATSNDISSSMNVLSTTRKPGYTINQEHGFISRSTNLMPHRPAHYAHRDEWVSPEWVSARLRSYHNLPTHTPHTHSLFYNSSFQRNYYNHRQAEPFYLTAPPYPLFLPFQNYTPFERPY